MARYVFDFKKENFSKDLDLSGFVSLFETIAQELLFVNRVPAVVSCNGSFDVATCQATVTVQSFSFKVIPEATIRLYLEMAWCDANNAAM